MLQFKKKNDQVTLSFYEHHKHVAEAYTALLNFFDVLFSDNPETDKLKEIKATIDQCEAEGDRNLRATISLLKKSFLPTTRKNMITMLQLTDEVANGAQAITRQIILEKITLPKALNEGVREILKITEKQLNIIYKATDLLLNDYKTIYNDRTILHDIRVEETHVDTIENDLHEKIFNMELSLCEKIYYRDIVSSICQISDLLEDIADQIQIMLVEREA